MPISEFRVFVSEALDYWRHLEIWSAVFPDCAVYTCEEASNNICEFFFRNALQLTNTEEFEALDLRVNVGLSRARELAKRHARIRRGAGYRIERSALLAQQFIQQRPPMLAWIIPLGRSCCRGTGTCDFGGCGA